ncbi:MAG TPA: hypothetical protein DCM10_19630 [Xanthomarina gelatinilytica]|uniref:hypothetical protein n=1 Tax=Xanthomarina sp. TaxID=1931211 RepID=UPI000C62C2BD|nr:hypothetical protein [Xanthomarina sp.]MAL21667.1 hypothetical protein [Xanthomarina sp.]HAI20023.1 hypothetical protein [Xanthomarina gelatinilytica]|tara:strand:+ start:432 stop:887 length:456 start_codon:yes stop_codon:yes gene_type:complete
MNVDLNTFSFLIISRNSEPTVIVDWEFLGTHKEDITPQILNFEFDISKITDGFEVIVKTDILLSCYNLHKSDVMKGTFYKYPSYSTFHVDSKNINSIIVSELIQAHYVSCVNEVLFDTQDKTNKQNPHLLQIPSLSTTISTVESFDYNYNL